MTKPDFKRGDRVKLKRFGIKAVIRKASDRYRCWPFGCYTWIEKGELHAATKYGDHLCFNCVKPAG